jgi:hypothetical protein
MKRKNLVSDLVHILKNKKVNKRYWEESSLEFEKKQKQ